MNEKLVPSKQQNQELLQSIVDSWDRNNTILLNLLHKLPEGSLEARATEDGPSVGQLFTHIHYVRLVFISEDAPEFAQPVPETEWVAEHDAHRIAEMLTNSARVVSEAVKKKLETGGNMDIHYDHPILLLQHMLWHEGYHHGQMKLALKISGIPLSDKEAGPVTWSVWMKKSRTITATD